MFGISDEELYMCHTDRHRGNYLRDTDPMGWSPDLESLISSQEDLGISQLEYVPAGEVTGEPNAREGLILENEDLPVIGQMPGVPPGYNFKDDKRSLRSEEAVASPSSLSNMLDHYLSRDSSDRIIGISPTLPEATEFPVPDPQIIYSCPSAPTEIILDLDSETHGRDVEGTIIESEAASLGEYWDHIRNGNRLAALRSWKRLKRVHVDRMTRLSSGRRVTDIHGDEVQAGSQAVLDIYADGPEEVLLPDLFRELKLDLDSTP